MNLNSLLKITYTQEERIVNSEIILGDTEDDKNKKR